MAEPRRIHQSLLTPPFFLGLPLEALFAAPMLKNASMIP